MHKYTIKIILLQQGQAFKNRLPFVLIENLHIDQVLRMEPFMKRTGADMASILPGCLSLPCRTQSILSVCTHWLPLL